MASDVLVDLKNTWKGIKAMRLRNKATWSIKLMPRRFWLHFWTPVWHDCNGPYLSCGMWFIAVYRGY